MQNLEVISVNLWQILISLCNLLILFLIIKKFLFAPVKRVMAERQGEIAKQYKAAEEAERAAASQKAAWDEKMAAVDEEADTIIKDAADKAKRRSDVIISDAKSEADGIIRQARTEAELEMKRAEDAIRHEIVEVSSELAEKLLEREIDTDDHKEFIDSFIDNIGKNNG